MKDSRIRIVGVLVAAAVLTVLMASAGNAAQFRRTLSDPQSRSARGHETLRLGANRDYSRPGGGVQVRIENDTTSEVIYGLQYELAVRKKGAWIRLSTRPVFSPRLFVAPESVSAWQRIPIPKEAAPGRYRIRKQVQIVLAERTAKRQIDTTFRVSDS